MSRYLTLYEDKKIKEKVKVKEGFNWWAFIFSVLWYAYHGLWGKAAAYFIIYLIATFGTAFALSDAGDELATLAGIVILFAPWVIALFIGSNANKDYADSLREKGYKEEVES